MRVNISHISKRKNYIVELYDDELPDEASIEFKTKGNLEGKEDYILRKEFEISLKKQEDRKASGIDGIPMEPIKYGGDKWKENLYQLVHDMYNRGKVSDYFKNAL